MRKFHVTYFIVNSHNGSPLLTGVTVEAESIFFAIQRAINDHKIDELKIKYVIEL
jgi:hypothetical protein